MIFTRLARKNGAASSLALAIALATGAAVGATAVLEAPASAQKRPKYSKAFVAAYTPLQTALSAETPDAAAIKAAIPAVVAAIENEDDRYAAGGAIVGASQKINDLGLALQGLELMLQSGKVAPEQVGMFNMQAGQIAYNRQEYTKARTFIQAALDAGYTDGNPEGIIAESYFAEDRDAEGLAYLSGVVDARKSAGQSVDEAWLQRGLAVAYRGSMKDEVSKFAKWYVTDYPSETSWRDAIAILLNTGGYQNPEILDLLRLGRRIGTLNDSRLYMEYVDAADYRRLPAEVVSVIDEGKQKGFLPADDAYVNDTRNQAAERVAADRADMDSLIGDARAAGANIRTVMAAGDALLSLGRPAEAEEFYVKAAGMTGAETPMALTRLGIAQLEQGKFAEAAATFDRVEGPRAAIADLWAIYAAQEGEGSAAM
jgi:tetratricopeptide (TPR) repeat protein